MWITTRHRRAVTRMKSQWLLWYAKDTHKLKQKKIPALGGGKVGIKFND